MSELDSMHCLLLTSVIRLRVVSEVAIWVTGTSSGALRLTKHLPASSRSRPAMKSGGHPSSSAGAKATLVESSLRFWQKVVQSDSTARILASSLAWLSSSSAAPLRSNSRSTNWASRSSSLESGPRELRGTLASFWYSFLRRKLESNICLRSSLAALEASRTDLSECTNAGKVARALLAAAVPCASASTANVLSKVLSPSGTSSTRSRALT
mmetsp:Transcript_25613/g.48504  ORF Transcript_25613/g.48504 Transcript_25613/m.48504 type:complete len:211 (+) Transcript_25613:1581-2213(+)